MKRHCALFLVTMVTAACSRQGDTKASSANGSSSSAPAVESAIAEKAVKDYVASLADGSWEGLFKYDKGYLREAEAARQSVPSSMWPDKEARLKSQWSELLAGLRQAHQYDPAGSDATNQTCLLVLKSGGTINFSKLEVRLLPDGRSQAFVQVDYADQASAPAVLWHGASRKLKSATLNLTVEPNGQGAPFVNERCEPVEGALTVFETPKLTKEQAVQLASSVIPSRFSAAIASTIYPATPDIRALLEKHGMVFEYGNRIKPSDRVRAWVTGPAGPSYSDNPGWNVVLLDHANTVIADLNQTGPQASATLTTTFSGCTEFCELWKELGGSRQAVFGSSDYNGRPPYDLGAVVSTETKVKYVFDLNNGWGVVH